MSQSSSFIILNMLIMWSYATAVNYEAQLIENLLQNYTPMVRPALNHTIPTKVFMELKLVNIFEVDEKSQSLKTLAWMSITWNDLNLQWDPNNYNGLKETRIPSDRLWKPDITLSNDIEEFKLLSEQIINLIVYSNGTVLWSPSCIFRSWCLINVRNFPYDEQICSISFISQSYSPSQLYLVVGSKLPTSQYRNNTEWELISLISEEAFSPDRRYQVISFKIQIKRKPLFVFFNMMLPCFFTIGVALLAFIVPAGSGEKMSIGITTLLSSSVLLLVISSDLPRCSDYVPLIGLFYAVSTGIIALITLASVFTLNLHHYGENGADVPKIVQKVFFNIIGQIILLPRWVSLRKMKYEEEDKKLQWTLLADIFDRLFLYIFIIGASVSMQLIINMRS